MPQLFETPLGCLEASFNEAGALTRLIFTDKKLTSAKIEGPLSHQLAEYFRGARKIFDIPLAPAGTEFQKSVWRELCKIPYGATLSYAQIARQLGNPLLVRAAAAANGANPIAILIPCHRVIGSDGSLTGYAGGLERKRALLELEGALAFAQTSLQF